MRRREWLWTLATYGGAILVTALTAVAIILALKGNPAVAFQAAWHDTLGSIGGVGQVLNRMTPLFFASLAFAIGFHGGLFNIGMDGQIYIGAVFATGAGLLLAGSGLPGWLLVALLLVAGIVGGALWSGIAAVMRALWGVNEIFTTVMLNFVALYVVQFLCVGPWNDPAAGEAITRPIPGAAVLPMLIRRGGAHAGVLLTLAAGLLLWWLLYRTVPGYELRAAGASARAARVGGISLVTVQLTALLIGGAISGLAGAVEVQGVHNRLLVGLSPDYGIMAILIAVLGRFHPLLLLPVNFAFAVLVAGSDSLQRTVGFPAAGVLMLQALVVLVVLGVGAWRTKANASPLTGVKP